MAIFAAHDDRLVILDDEAIVAHVWSAERKRWVPTGADFARKAWVDGTDLTEEKAKARFPDADWDSLPEFDEAK